MDATPTNDLRPHLVRAPAHARPGVRLSGGPATLTAAPTGEGSTSSRIRVSVLSTSHIARIGIRGLLATTPSRITVVEDTETGRTPRTNGTSLDVTIVDVAAFDDPDHRRTVERAIQRSESVVAIAAGFHPGLPPHLQGLGVDSCVSPDISGPDLVAVIESAALDPGTHDPGAPPARRVPGLCRGTEAAFLAGLSTREHHIVAKIAQGLSNQAIAEELFLSINSVKSYIRSSYRKMGVQTRSEAVIWAFHQNIGYAPIDTGRSSAVGS